MAKLCMPSTVPPATGAAGSLAAIAISYSSNERRRIRGWRSVGCPDRRSGEDNVRECEGRREAGSGGGRTGRRGVAASSISFKNWYETSKTLHYHTDMVATADLHYNSERYPTCHSPAYSNQTNHNGRLASMSTPSSKNSRLTYLGYRFNKEC